MFQKRIKKFIELINNKNNNWISANELRLPEDKYADEFIDEIEIMKSIGLIQLRKSSNTNMPMIKLSPLGAYNGREFINNYDEIFNEVISSIKLNHSLNNDVEISKELNIPRIFVSAVLKDLENQNLVEIKSGMGGNYISKFTDRGKEYFSNK